MLSLGLAPPARIAQSTKLRRDCFIVLHIYIKVHFLYPGTVPMRPLITRAALLRASTSAPITRANAPVPSRGPRPTQCRFSSTQAPATEKLSPRWLSDVRARIGKCIMFGINDGQTSEAGSILQEVSSDWRELLAGSEGFLTGQEYRGLYRQEVVWGEMVGCANDNMEEHVEG